MHKLDEARSGSCPPERTDVLAQSRGARPPAAAAARSIAVNYPNQGSQTTCTKARQPELRHSLSCSPAAPAIGPMPTRCGAT